MSLMTWKPYPPPSPFMRCPTMRMVSKSLAARQARSVWRSLCRFSRKIGTMSARSESMVRVMRSPAPREYGCMLAGLSFVGLKNLQQCGLFHRLCNVGIAAGLEHLGSFLLQCQRRERDDAGGRQIVVALPFADRPRGRVP